MPRQDLASSLQGRRAEARGSTPDGKTVRLWRYDLDVLLGRAPAPDAVQYTSAKVALVSDFGSAPGTAPGFSDGRVYSDERRIPGNLSASAPAGAVAYVGISKGELLNLSV